MMEFTTGRLLKTLSSFFDGLPSTSLRACPELDEGTNGEKFAMIKKIPFC